MAPGSPAEVGGLQPGDEIVGVDGRMPRDVIEWRLVVDEAEVSFDVMRGGLGLSLQVHKEAGTPLGAEVASALFDQVRTCDNHCEFCFIYQLPPGLRSSLYVKDDDYRLSFLYGNYTTLTRFTELDLERIVTERLSPLNVSIHSTDPDLRAAMLRNRRGATSLRWLRGLLDAGIEVHGQVVVCPGVNDGEALDRTLAGVADRFPDLATLCVVPLGVSRWSTEASLRPHTLAEAATVVEVVERWQETFLGLVGRRLVFAADEYYLLAGVDFPPGESYEGFPMHEDGIGMARAFELELMGRVDHGLGVAPGFFSWVDGAPAEGYRSLRGPATAAYDAGQGDGSRPVRVLTGAYGARVLDPLLARLRRADGSPVEARTLVVPNRFFGGNVAVAGLMVGEDVAATLAADDHGPGRSDVRYLLPDVCLSGGRFLDGMAPEDLGAEVEVVATDGLSLRRALLGSAVPA